jgi:cardiolipin synthase
MFKLAYIPNAICFVRIALIVPIIGSLLAGNYSAALVLILLAGFSDGLDGFLAKRFDWRTRLGGILDPFADKLLLVSVFVALAWLEVTPLWLTAVVIGRDLVIVMGALAYNYLIGEVRPEPTRISKLNTALQLLYVLLVLTQAASALPLDVPVLLAGAGVMVSSVVSGLDYVLTWGGRARAVRA